MAVLLTVLGIIALRLVDVSIGTLRIQYVVRGRRLVAGALGFVESITWVIAVGLVLTDLDEWYKVVAYAAGFGLGTAAGGYLDGVIASGQVFLRVMSPITSPEVAPQLRRAGFAATVLNGEGLEGDVRLTLAAMPRRQLNNALDIIRSVNPEAFVTTDEINASSAGAMKAGRLRK